MIFSTAVTVCSVFEVSVVVCICDGVFSSGRVGRLRSGKRFFGCLRIGRVLPVLSFELVVDGSVNCTIVSCSIGGSLTCVEITGLVGSGLNSKTRTPTSI